MAFPKGVSGNPTGRPVGIIQIRSQHAQEVFAKHNFDSLEESIKLAQSFQGTILAARDPEVKLEYRKLLLLMLQTLVKYQYPQLKAVEHHGEVNVTHTFKALEVLPDAELVDALTVFRGEQHALRAANGT